MTLFLPFKAVIFDLDGTLIDSVPDLARATNALLAAHHRPSVTDMDVSKMVGDGAAWLIRRAFQKTGEEAGEDDIPALTRQFLDYYEGHEADNTVVYPGVFETLAALQSAGLQLAICSNKPQKPTEGALNGLGLTRYFDVVFGGDQLDGIRKPDPKPLQIVMERLGVQPNAALMVGDNANDVGTARNAGVKVIVVDYGYSRINPNELDADAVISTMADLSQTIQRVAKI